MTEHRIQLSGGGVFAWLGNALHLPSKPSARIALQLTVTILVLWLPLVVLSAMEGAFVGTQVAEPLLRDTVPHARLLLAVPMLLVAGRLIDPRVSAAAQYLEDAETIPASERSAYRSAEESLMKARSAVWPDLLILVFAYVVTWTLKPGYGDLALDEAATTWAWSSSGGEVTLSRAGWWYLLVSGPLFQFVLFRWTFLFLLWATFLFRVSRLPLTLRPAHPDTAGGIGYLGIAQQSFTVVFFALSTVLAATVAHDILVEGQTFQAARVEIATLAALLVIVLYLPLFFFTPQLVRARERGFQKYGLVGHKLFEQFGQKWAETAEDESGKALLASTEPSTTADYSATYENVRNMRVVPVTFRGAVVVAIVLVLPFAPLALTQYSIGQLLDRLLSALV